MRKHLAVDVALIPPDDIISTAIAANRVISEKRANRVKLNRINCLPHITLAMGCIDTVDVGRIDENLSSIAKHFSPLDLVSVPSMEKAWFELQFDEYLQTLHETVMMSLGPYLSYGASKNMLYNPSREQISEITLSYIRKFPEESSFEYYTPHITIGSGNKGISLPRIRFTASEMALYQMGNYCTCGRKILSYRLTESRVLVR